MKNVIYRIRNVVNGHYYIGSTVDSKKRFWDHRKHLRTGVHACVRLQRAWNKHGEDCFKFEVLEQLPDRSGLCSAEQKYLDAHFGTEYMYNTASQAYASMREASPEMRAHLAQKTREHAAKHGHPRLGHTHTEETKERIRQIRLANPTRYWEGKTRSDETKAKISAAQAGVSKGSRTFTPEGLAAAQENMRKNAREQAPADFAAVKAKFHPDVLAKYDFSNAVYTGALERITGCVCPVHGEFSQYSAQFRKGRGCPQCGAEQRAESKRKQMQNSWATPEGRESFLSARKK